MKASLIVFFVTVLSIVLKTFLITATALVTFFLVVSPEGVGTWQARAELAFLEEAERIGMWSE
jgi:hypothetical protein